MKRTLLLAAVLIPVLCACLHAAGEPSVGNYVLGPEDLVSIRILQAPELSERPLRIDRGGNIQLPFLGSIPASGRTVDQLSAEITMRLREFMHEPQVSIGIEEYRSQPISVIGAVNTPGMQQLLGRRTLIEVLSLAGGVRTDSGHTVRITRRLDHGPIDLPNVTRDPSGQFSLAEINLRSLLDAKNPRENILIQPQDVISVPRADMVYVIGEVEKSGGYVLNEREALTALQALSLAGGLRPAASPQSARILRSLAPGSERTELPVDLKKILAGKTPDVALRPDDILFLPSNASKRAGMRVLEAAIQMGTGVVIWRR